MDEPILYAFRSDSGIGRDGGALYKLRETGVATIVYRTLPTDVCNCGFEDCKLIGTTTLKDFVAPYGTGGRESNSYGVEGHKEPRIIGVNCASAKDKFVNPFYKPHPDFFKRHKRPDTPPAVRAYLAKQEAKLAAREQSDMDTS